VGATWTVELRPVDEGALAHPVEWICSGVPTQQPIPDRQTANLLREHGWLLLPVDPIGPMPQTRSRRLIGYVTRNAEVMRLALMLADVVDAGHDHPMVLAARWIHAGYTADMAARWLAAGMN